MTSPLQEANKSKFIALARANYSASLTEGELRIIDSSVRPRLRPPEGASPSPEVADKHRSVPKAHGDFFRWLLNDVRIPPLIDADGLQVLSLTIDGRMDLDNSHIPFDLWFESCVFTDDVSFAWADTRSIHITDSTAQKTIKLEHADVKGEVVLDSTRSLGSIEMDGIQVSGSISLRGAKLQDKGTSLSLDDATITGSVHLEDDFQALGSISLSGSVIKQDVWVVEAELSELDCSGAQIGGDLTWAAIVRPKETALTLVSTRVKKFADVKKSWPAQNKLSVTGFVYEQISVNVPPDLPDLTQQTTWKAGEPRPDDRIEWLELQSKEDQIVAQPWMQLAQILQARGNSAGAKKVLYRMKRLQARDRWFVPRSASFIYDVVEEDPLRISLPILLLWAFGAVVFWRARRMNTMAPTEKDAYDHFLLQGDRPPHYTPFNAAVYALENVLPVVKLGQDGAWGPNPQSRPIPLAGWKRWLPRLSYSWLALLRWLLIVLGWVLALILAGAIGGRFKP